MLLHLWLTHLWVKRVPHLMPDWLRIHLEVVQKHSCAGSVCNFLSLASQTHYCASHPNHNHMGPGAAVEFSHWQRDTLSVRRCRAAGLVGPELLTRIRSWMSLFLKTPVTFYSANSARWLCFISLFISAMTFAFPSLVNVSCSGHMLIFNPLVLSGVSWKLHIALLWAQMYVFKTQ